MSQPQSPSPRTASVEPVSRAAGPSRFVSYNFPPSVVIVASVAMLIGTAYLDWATGPDMHMGFFYAFPAVLTTWFIGRRPGYFMAIISTATWLVAEWAGAAAYQRQSMIYVNSAFRLVCLLLTLALLAAFNDLRKYLEAMVKDRTKSLRRLAAQLAEAEDSERRRLAHDIHDGFGQMLSLLKLNLASAASENGRANSNSSTNQIGDAVAIVDELIQRSRTLTFDLHPAMLDHLGLVPTLRHHAEQFSRQTGIELTVHEEGVPQTLESLKAKYLFRSVRELINNAAKHGHAKQVLVSVYWESGAVRIVVDDDGTGFMPDQTPGAGSAKGLGLPGIRERLLSLDGTCRVESSAGAGTRVVLELPRPFTG